MVVARLEEFFRAVTFSPVWSSVAGYCSCLAGGAPIFHSNLSTIQNPTARTSLSGLSAFHQSRMAPATRKRPRTDSTTDTVGGLDAAPQLDLIPTHTEPKMPSHSDLPIDPIDPDGDLLLLVGRELSAGVQGRLFKVCSAAMRRSSSVWKRMLFGQWAEAKPAQGDWLVELPEDDPTPVLTLLWIIHGKFEKVPLDTQLSFLRDILIIADKYDLMHTIRPWAGTWMKVVTRSQNLTPIGRTMRLHTAWELGCKDVVEEEMSNLVFNLECHGPLMFYYEGRQLIFSNPCGPPDLIGKSVQSDCLPAINHRWFLLMLHRKRS